MELSVFQRLSQVSVLFSVILQLDFSQTNRLSIVETVSLFLLRVPRGHRFLKGKTELNLA